MAFTLEERLARVSHGLVAAIPAPLSPDHALRLHRLADLDLAGIDCRDRAAARLLV